MKQAFIATAALLTPLSLGACGSDQDDHTHSAPGIAKFNPTSPEEKFALEMWEERPDATGSFLLYNEDSDQFTAVIINDDPYNLYAGNEFFVTPIDEALIDPSVKSEMMAELDRVSGTRDDIALRETNVIVGSDQGRDYYVTDYGVSFAVSWSDDDRLQIGQGYAHFKCDVEINPEPNAAIKLKVLDGEKYGVSQGQSSNLDL